MTTDTSSADQVQTPEHRRLAEADAGQSRWRRWGPYLAERQWGTVREDYSAHGDAWDYFPHDHARSRVYRWGEDGIAGFSDDEQYLCQAVALWNERDPILKERLFGLTGSEGNHGEDVKEYYFFLDGTPSHSYMKMLYKYPQVAYPYDRLVTENRRRSRTEPEFELFDAIGDDFRAGRYFDVVVEYAKAGPEDLLCRITVFNRGDAPAPLHVLPHLWFRNTWSWAPDQPKPALRLSDHGAVVVECEPLGPRWWYCQASNSSMPEFHFTENESNTERLWSVANRSPYVKDGINEAVVNGVRAAVNEEMTGTKAAAHVHTTVPPGGSITIDTRLSDRPLDQPFADAEVIFRTRIAEADAFYEAVHGPALSEDERLVQRQALAGMLWSKQFYLFDVEQWLSGDPAQPPPPAERRAGRNREWHHLNASDIISMPDTWEYPWFAAWDLAFHCIPLAMVDLEFAKGQLELLGRGWYQHPNGQFPAYEWAFGDVNPPVLATAVWRLYQMEVAQRGTGDRKFLERMFLKLQLNFSWWVNRKDPEGNNVFGGGFLGLDNIGVFDRSAPLPNGVTLEQADGTSWMAVFALAMLAIAVELAADSDAYSDIAVNYVAHALYIGEAIYSLGGEDIHIWSEDDQFFYDVLSTGDGRHLSLGVRSMVGLIPLAAVVVFESEQVDRVPDLTRRLRWFIENRPHLAERLLPYIERPKEGRRILALLGQRRLPLVLRRMLDESEFLSDYGIRALSRFHQDHPYVFDAGGTHTSVAYTPAESDSAMFGGNSNWRGPIWLPVNYLLVEALRGYHRYFEDDLTVECPTGSGRMLTLGQVADEIAARLARIFLRDPERGGVRAVLGDNDYFQSDPHWRDYIPFHEYFHGDTGRGVGASHQTGWTGLIAALLADKGSPLPGRANPPP